MKRSTTLQLRGRHALATFGSPLRLELVDQFQRGGALSIRELADRMERPADSLYFHVRKLLRAGVVVERELRPTGKRPERVFALAAIGLRIDPRDRSAPAVEASHRGARAVLRMAERQFRAAIEAGRARRDGPRRNLLVARIKSALSAEELAELHRRVDALIAWLRARGLRRRGDPVVLTLVLTPLVKKAGRRSIA